MSWAEIKKAVNSDLSTPLNSKIDSQTTSLNSKIDTQTTSLNSKIDTQTSTLNKWGYTFQEQTQYATNISISKSYGGVMIINTAGNGVKYVCINNTSGVMLGTGVPIPLIKNQTYYVVSSNTNPVTIAFFKSGGGV